MIFCLPYPPTVNTYWRYVNGRPMVSKEGRVYQQRVMLRLKSKWVEPIKEPVKVEVMLCAVDYRRRDIDNSMKALLDAITKAGVYEDDSLIDELRILRGNVIKPGFALLRIMPLPPKRNPWGVFPWAMSEEANRALCQGGVQVDRGLLDVPVDEEVQETEPAF